MLGLESWEQREDRRIERARRRTENDLNLVAAALSLRTGILDGGAPELKDAGFENYRLLAATDPGV